MSYPIPTDESTRLNVLRSYDILDTPPEQAYDDLVSLAAQICDVPLASITLVDETRQWFKASIGLSGKETPRDISFCAHAICTDGQDLFVVPDTHKDSRFAPLSNVVGAPHIRFYAGAPLVTSDGWALGTLCVIDRKPRELTPDQQQALRVLRHHVVSALELRRLVATQRATILELEETQTKLKEATRAKSLFLAAMSHEIRTPMNAVIGMTALLSDTSLSPEQQECVDTISTSGDLLLTVINDILDFSKIESGHLQIEKAPFVVSRCVDDAVAVVADRAAAKGILLRVIFDPGLPIKAIGDAGRCRQILVNLLSNAVKFTDRGSITVRVAANHGPSGGDQLELSVDDTGIGLSPEQIGRLFKQYSQADVSTARRFGGTGLGLAISNRLAELHGGRMWVTSEVDRGSVFHFTLSVERDATPSAEPSGPKRPPSVFDAEFSVRHPARILLVEDNPVNQKVATRILAKLGYAPAIANQGREALALLLREKFDLVLMDIEMPEMDGPTATQALRAQGDSASQPVVVALTAHAIAEERSRCLAAGMDGFLTKPIRVEELTDLLSRYRELRGS
jgi:signal transduction histidine kinase/ActR/RegA family two-component response regulator